MKNKNIKKYSLFYIFSCNARLRASFVYMVLVFVISTTLVCINEMKFFRSENTYAKVLNKSYSLTIETLECEFYIDGIRHSDTLPIYTLARNVNINDKIEIEYINTKGKLKLRIKPNIIEKFLSVLSLTFINSVFTSIFFILFLEHIKSI